MIGRQTILGFRLALQWSRREFADAIPVAVRTLERWETGFTDPSPLAERQIRELMRRYPKAVKKISA